MPYERAWPMLRDGTYTVRDVGSETQTNHHQRFNMTTYPTLTDDELITINVNGASFDDKAIAGDVLVITSHEVTIFKQRRIKISFDIKGGLPINLLMSVQTAWGLSNELKEIIGDYLKNSDEITVVETQSKFSPAYSELNGVREDHYLLREYRLGLTDKEAVLMRMPIDNLNRRRLALFSDGVLIGMSIPAASQIRKDLKRTAKRLLSGHDLNEDTER